MRILSVEKVSQVELVDNAQLLVLADKTLWSFPVEMLDSEIQAKKIRPISQHAAFFHVGQCMGKTLVCVVKTSTLTPTTIRVLEPVMAEEDKKGRRKFIQRLVRNGSENLRPYKDLYLPSEASAISLLKTKMCVSCPQEIGVIDMKTFEVQGRTVPSAAPADYGNDSHVPPFQLCSIQTTKSWVSFFLVKMCGQSLYTAFSLQNTWCVTMVSHGDSMLRFSLLMYSMTLYDRICILRGPARTL